MKPKYRLLLTKKSFKSLRNIPKDLHENVTSFLNSLISGEWEKNDSTKYGSITTWKPKDNDKDRYLFSCKVGKNQYAIWETLWSVDVANRLNYADLKEDELGHDYSCHILLYCFETFPGQPDTVMHLGNEIFQFNGEMDQQHLGIYEREPQDEISYNEELYLLASSRINSVLSGEQRGLPLHMIKEQINILGTHRTLRGPILLSGEAGSGKTVVITHWLVINQFEEKVHSQLFVTFSGRLTEQTKQMFEQMLPPEMPHNVRFLTYRYLLLEISNAGGLSFKDPSKEMTFERFLREYSRRIRQNVDGVLLWDEIRSVIKGGCTDPIKRIIDYSTYEKLSEERGRCKTPKKLREDYYKGAQLYQNYLDKEGMWDSIDLAFDCLQCVDKIQHFDKIACDEVQDLAPVEIRVLINILKDKKIDNIFFTGDTAQVINPSGFQWSRLKGDLGEISQRRDIRDQWELHRNFRSTNEIVKLVNEVIKIREKILDDTSERNIQRSEIKSAEKPMLLKSSMIKEVQNAIASSKQRLILVKTKDQKKHIKDLLKDKPDIEKPTILTVEEAKGLEWDGVLLWNFFIPRHEIITKNDWEDIFIPNKRNAFPKLLGLGKKDPYGLTYEFNLLHVGLTRARNHLFIYDQDDTLNIKNLSDTLDEITREIEPEEFYTIWKTTPPTPQELKDLAQNLLERDRDQAFQFFKIAAGEFEKQNKLEDAADCYIQANEYKLAAGCFEKDGNYVMQKKMLAKHYELKNQWVNAGKYWEEYCSHLLEKNELDDALLGYENAAEAYENGKRMKDAAKAMEHRAQCLSKEKEIKYIIQRAKSLYYAAEYYENAPRSLENAIQAMNSAINIVRDDVIPKSAKEKISIDGKIPNEWVASSFNEISLLYEKDKRILEAAQTSMNAASFFKKTSDKVDSKHEKTRVFHDQIKSLSRSVDLYNKARKNDTAIDVQQELIKLLKDRMKKGYDYPDFDIEWDKLIDILKENGQVNPYLKETNDFVRHQRRNNRKDRGYEILQDQIIWCKVNNYPEHAINLLEVKEEFHKEDEEYSQVGKVLDEIGHLQDEIGERRDAISSYIKAGKNYLKLDLLGRALQSFENGKNIAFAEMTPSSLGWYCFRDITIDSLIKGYEEHAKKWMNEAVKSFVGEYNPSVKRIEGFIKIYEEKLQRNLIVSEENDSNSLKNKKIIEVLEEKYNTMKEALNPQQVEEIDDKATVLGWSWFCLASLHHKAIGQKIAPLAKRKSMEEAYDNSVRYFYAINERDMASYVRSGKIDSEKI